MSSSFSSANAMDGLKDFQKRTVDYVFERLYGEDSTSRFLVADEVGLGKTLVAKGIIAKTVEFLYSKVDRIDIIYVCSNASIASQNVSRLNMTGIDGFSIATRLTYLPKQVGELSKKKVNFISLTPVTALDHTRSRGGQKDERAILYWMLHDLLFAQKTKREQMRKGLFNMLQATASKEGWKWTVDWFNVGELDLELSKLFRKAVLADKELYTGLKEVCSRFIRFGDNVKIPQDDSELRYKIISKLRAKLASVCLKALEPDLVILDEFQRFKYLLSSDDDASLLARELFNYKDVRVLLLSATPYKMFTLNQESDEDDHYPDFVKTLEFLFNDTDELNEVKRVLSEHRKSIHACAKRVKHHTSKKAELENALLKVMCRTERVATTKDCNAMLFENEQSATVIPSDLQHAAIMDSLARCVKAREPIEYWKSIPYLMNFLKHYELRRKLDAHLAKKPSRELSKLLSLAEKSSLKKEDFEKYCGLNPANPRMRLLFKDTIDSNMWQLLWMPPSMPYTELGGVFFGKENLTKVLVFSSWSAVPDAVASMCSYEAERKMVLWKPRNKRKSAHKDLVMRSKLYNNYSTLLKFSTDSKSSRMAGMPVVTWLLPFPRLAFEVDPLKIAFNNKEKVLTVKDLKAEATKICQRLIEKLPKGVERERIDKRWYWAAPMLIELDTNLLNLCKQFLKMSFSSSNQGQDAGFGEHLDELVNVVDVCSSFGPKPKDLAEVLCEFALAGPGICSLRALSRIVPDFSLHSHELLSAAVKIANGFRSLYNIPENIALLRKGPAQTYWRTTLQYGIDGNLQAVLDEYVHTLKESLGLKDKSLEKQIAVISDHMQSVLSLRTAQMRIDELVKGKFVGFNTRCRFALRFGDIQDDSEQKLTRADQVRDAFNSPFRPFVLASTSIGQEGLDFHTWCHAVMHWNLPSNPVDIEQREGRVHRYKGHAVRKNIAEKYGLKSLSGIGKIGDPWQSLFDIANHNKPIGSSDLIPYWIFEDGSARVERRVPLIPFSKEVIKFKQLKKSLALYRMVFGQPRQEDLLSILLNQNDSDGYIEMADWIISLQPPKV